MFLIMEISSSKTTAFSLHLVKQSTFWLSLGGVCWEMFLHADMRLLWWFGKKKWPPKGKTLLGGVILLEEVCHCGGGLWCFFAQASLGVTVS